jgi:hypothetical protein
MTIPEDPLQPENGKEPSSEETPPEEVEFPEEASLPEDFTPLIRPDDLSSPSRARRRRARRTLTPPGDDERASMIEDLARRAFPSVEFFLLAFLCGLLMGAGYLLDSDALLLVGVLLAPLLTPWVGMTLAAATGGWRFFLQTLGSQLVAFLLAFLTSALVGLLNRVIDLSKFYRAADHSKLWWTDLLIVIAGAVLLELAFLRGERRPILPSILLAYGLFLPISAAGFGLGAGLPEFWPDSILIFLVHLALGTLTGIIVLTALHFKPAKASGYLLPVLLGLLCVAALAVFTGLAGWVINRVEPPTGNQTPTPLGLVSPTPGLPPSATPGVPSRTPTIPPSEKPSATPTETPAPSYAVIAATTGGGANFRTEPGGGALINTLLNGIVVEVLPEIQAVGTVEWVRIRTLDGVEGWVLQNVLTATTPPPTVTITLTPTP